MKKNRKALSARLRSVVIPKTERAARIHARNAKNVGKNRSRRIKK